MTARLDRFAASEGPRRLFFAGLGLVFVMAFLSLRVQVDGLIGSRGILPAGELLQLLLQRAHADAPTATLVHELPTLLWLDPSDTMLHMLCGAGIACGVLLVLGVAPLFATPACWLLYLSLVSVGEEFLRFQWDSLLLEVALFATFFAPSGLLPWRGTPRPPSFASLWALRLLLFRFMFASGAVKILCRDPAWDDCTALTYHYWTQPLPTLLGWYAHQMPLWFHRFSCKGMFAVELYAPWLVFFGTIGRRLFALATIGLMATIGATGNYGFFEPLTVVLCVPLLVTRPRAEPRLDIAAPKFDFATLRRGLVSSSRLLSSFTVATFAALGVVLFAEQLTEQPVDSPTWRPAQQSIAASIAASGLFQETRAALAPFTSLNTYGLFRVMTKERPSIEIQGSDDQSTWKSYAFRWKEGDLAQPPRLCEPHMPRLDWQMWFAALRRAPEPWFLRFMKCLLEGEPDVLALLADNPFPDRPPHFVRAIRFDYEFTTSAERAATGNWWKRRETGVYQSPLWLR